MFINEFRGFVLQFSQQERRIPIHLSIYFLFFQYIQQELRNENIIKCISNLSIFIYILKLYSYVLFIKELEQKIIKSIIRLCLSGCRKGSKYTSDGQRCQFCKSYVVCKVWLTKVMSLQIQKINMTNNKLFNVSCRLNHKLLFGLPCIYVYCIKYMVSKEIILSYFNPE